MLYPLSLFLSVSPVKFEDCQRSREMGFVSSDPNFSVRPDGTVYTEQEVANLSEPVQFMVTARGLHDPHIWETTVKLALAGHPHPLPLTKVMRPNNFRNKKAQGHTGGSESWLNWQVHKWSNKNFALHLGLIPGWQNTQIQTLSNVIAYYIFLLLFC